MSITTERLDQLNEICNNLRIELVDMLHRAQTGHPGGSLSVCEILTMIMLEKAKLDPENPEWEDRDRILLTKGHAAPMLYLLLGELGILDKEEYTSLRQLDTRLQGHPSMETPGVDITAGPLGIGLPAAVGMAAGLKLDNKDSVVYAVLGDGELNEGAVWEGIMSAVKFKLDNLICVLDSNGVQLDGTTEEIMPMHNMHERFESFGMNVIDVDGHDVKALSDAFDQAKEVKDKPTMIIAKTVKGKGISFMEGESSWHGNAISDEHYEQAMKELKG